MIEDIDQRPELDNSEVIWNGESLKVLEYQDHEKYQQWNVQLSGEQITLVKKKKVKGEKETALYGLYKVNDISIKNVEHYDFVLEGLAVAAQTPTVIPEGKKVSFLPFDGDKPSLRDGKND